MQYTNYTAFTPIGHLTAIICHFTLCLLCVLALARLFSGKSLTKEYNNGRSITVVHIWNQNTIFK